MSCVYQLTENQSAWFIDKTSWYLTELFIPKQHNIMLCRYTFKPCTSTYYQKNRIRYKYFTIVYIKHNFYSFSLHILFDAIYWQQVLSSKPWDWALKIAYAIPHRICLYRKHLYSKRGFAINMSCVYQLTENQSAWFIDKTRWYLTELFIPKQHNIMLCRYTFKLV
jgi:hypothetical protein